jgi:hypothetical protein
MVYMQQLGPSLQEPTISRPFVKFLGFIFLLFMFCSCDYGDSKLRIVNTSNKAIVLSLGDDINSDSLNKFPPYPIDNNDVGSYSYEYITSENGNFILAHSNKYINTFGTWESKFSSRNELTIFILDADVVKDKSWNYIRRNNLYLKKYHYKLDEIKAKQWTITY